MSDSDNEPPASASLEWLGGRVDKSVVEATSPPTPDARDTAKADKEEAAAKVLLVRPYRHAIAGPDSSTTCATECSHARQVVAAKEAARAAHSVTGSLSQ